MIRRFKLQDGLTYHHRNTVKNTAGTRPKVNQKKMVESPNTIMQIPNAKWLTIISFLHFTQGTNVCRNQHGDKAPTADSS
jgi:hypothetical protein